MMRKGSRRGITLVEIIVAMAITVVIGGVLITIFLAANNGLRDNSAFTDAQAVSETVSDKIQSLTEYSDQVVLAPSAQQSVPDKDSFDALFVRDGKLWISRRGAQSQVFWDDFYGRWQLGMELAASSQNEDGVMLTLTVTDRKSGKLTYRSQTAVRILNLAPASRRVEAAGAGPYAWFYYHVPD